MKYLNLGCGYHFSLQKEWTNVDFISTGQGVIPYNLINGIPFEDNSFDLVYHSHVLEHFSRKDGDFFLAECFRVLKPGGIIRIVVPDLERIVKEYLKCLEEGLANPGDVEAEANYEWMLLEMYDQTVRNVSGGSMAQYIFQKELKNQSFVFNRIGEEGRILREKYLLSKDKKDTKSVESTHRESRYLIDRLKQRLKSYILKQLNIDTKALAIGQFRISGEIHQWMYDRYSLQKLLHKHGGHDIVIRNAFNSYIKNWYLYNIDGKNGTTRKPDSLFFEAIK